MILLTIRIKGDAATYIREAVLPDTYSVSRENKDLQDRVERATTKANLETVDKIIVTAKLEW